MMSNFIPMVSSSPPPMDDGGFGWDDDDFGNFASAGDSGFSQPVSQNKEESTPSNNSNLPPDTSDDFASFDAFQTNICDTTTSSNHHIDNISPDTKLVDQRPETIELTDTNQVTQNVHIDTNKDMKHLPNGDLTDSGVYSSNLSPVQRNDLEVPVTKDKTNDKSVDDSDTTESKTNVDEPSDSTKAFDNTPNPDLVMPSESVTENDLCDDFDEFKANTENDSTNISKNQSNNYVQADSPQCLSDTQEMINEATDHSKEQRDNIDESNEGDTKVDNEINQSKDAIPTTSIPIIDDSNERIDKKRDINEIPSDQESENNAISDSVEREEPLNTFDDLTAIDDNAEPDDTVEGIKESESIPSKFIEQCTESVKHKVDDSVDSGNDKSDNVPKLENDQSNELDSVDEKSKPSDTHNDDLEVDSESKEMDKSLETDSALEQSVGEISATVTKSETSEEGQKQIKKQDTEEDIHSKPENDETNDDQAHSKEPESSAESGDNSEVKLNSDDSKDAVISDSVDKKASEDSGLNDNDFGEFGDFNEPSGDTFGDFNAGFDTGGEAGGREWSAFPDNSDIKADSTSENTKGDWAAFSSPGHENSVDVDNDKNNDEGDDWAAFSEPQTLEKSETEPEQTACGVDDVDDDDWGDFDDDDATQVTTSTPASTQSETEKLSAAKLQSMTKQEKLVYAVTACFPSPMSDTNMCNSASIPDNVFVDNCRAIWDDIKSLETTDDLTYHWNKSKWNTQLFTTLHIDTRNILVGHKKTPVPVFASGLTMLEPIKGQAPLKPDVLIDTSKSDLQTTTQESIPAAQFDWSSSGLTNPLEANNKSLNLDFLIQEQASKSSELESEFLSSSISSLPSKPTIQPLQNILSNLKATPTFKATNQQRELSGEAQKIVGNLPDLSFMKAKVLMFPVKMNYE